LTLMKMMKDLILTMLIRTLIIYIFILDLKNTNN
jgi:hypothetical protein